LIPIAMTAIEHQMREAAQVAASRVESGMRVGLGTGRTAAWFLRALAERRLVGLRCVTTSPETERAAIALGIPVEPFDQLDRLDITVDGADQVASDRWAIKGGHGAHLREKIVAAAADHFIVIVTMEKVVDVLHPPVPLELRLFGLPATIKQLGHAALRPGAPTSPDGGVIADWQGPIEDPAALATRLDHTPGLSAHGLFAPQLIDEVIVGGRGA
jgi:ribose 5-phosphate isomerase A